MATQIPNPEDGDRPEGPMPEVPDDKAPGKGRGPADAISNPPPRPDRAPSIEEPEEPPDTPVGDPATPARPITDHPEEQNSG